MHSDAASERSQVRIKGIMMTWRDKIRPMVAEIIEHYGRDDMKALRKALIAHRPHWVSGASHMTKIWRDEVNVQLGIKESRKAAKERKKDEAAGQSFMFKEGQ